MKYLIVGLFCFMALSTTASAMTASDVQASVNNARLQAGLPALQDNSLLDKSSLEKANYLCSTNIFSHTGSFALIYGTGYGGRPIGENLAWNVGYPDIQTTMNSWLASPDHRDNILAKFFDEQGAAAIICPLYQGESNAWIVVNQFGYRNLGISALPSSPLPPTEDYPPQPVIQPIVPQAAAVKPLSSLPKRVHPMYHRAPEILLAIFKGWRKTL